MTDYLQQQIPESNSLCKGLRVPRILFSAKVNSVEVNFLKISDVRLPHSRKFYERTEGYTFEKS